MSNTTVRADHDDLKTIQTTFNSQGEALEKMNQDIKACLETLEGGDWIGKGAKAFLAEMKGSVMPSLGRLRNAMSEASRITNQISQTMQQAEDDASNVFRVS